MLNKKSGYKLMLLISLAFLVSCATSPAAYREIDLAVNNSNFETALEAIAAGQESSRPIYSEKNAIMLFLDKGLLEHYAGDYRNSSQSLQEAERLIEEAYTKSITAGFLSYILNDNTKEYPGEDFEDIYINIFNALNYYKRGDINGALVEIRKLSTANGKLDMLARKYEYKDPNSGDTLEELVQKEARGAELPKGKNIEFNNSALARYLAALFYLADGKTDSARIEFEQLQRAFLTNKSVYQNPLPKTVEQVRNVPQGKALLNIISFSGLSPIKEEEQITYYYPFFNNSSLLSANFKLPKMVERPSRINRIEVVIDGNKKIDLELLENISAVVEETFAIRYANIVTKTYIRTLLKYLTADIAAVEIGKKQGALAGLAVAIAARKAFEATESADIRMSRYLPGKAYIGGIVLEPGTYNVTVNFCAGSAVISSVKHNDVIVREKGLNLIDAVSLK
ncbi:MAG: hypothetical protein LBI04_04170 [Treponema sp.]|jgi:hypothetical protein|nr:hypothetical protein [Treponema sp.]